MEDIIRVMKLMEGLQVIYQSGPGTKEENVRYSELIDQKINALDLLEHPEDYWIDADKHKIIPKK